MGQCQKKKHTKAMYVNSTHQPGTGTQINDVSTGWKKQGN